MRALYLQALMRHSTTGPQHRVPSRPVRLQVYAHRPTDCVYSAVTGSVKWVEIAEWFEGIGNVLWCISFARRNNVQPMHSHQSEHEKTI